MSTSLCLLFSLLPKTTVYGRARRQHQLRASACPARRTSLVQPIVGREAPFGVGVAGWCLRAVTCTAPETSVNTSVQSDCSKELENAPNRPASARRAKVRVAVQTTVAGSLPPLFKGQLGWLGRHDIQLHTVSAPGGETKWVAEVEGVRPHAVPMSRSFSPFKDLLALWRLPRPSR